MTSKLKFDLIRPPYFGGAWDFQIYKIFCLSTWTLNLQFKSFWVVFSERVCHTKEFFRSGFLEFDFLPKLLVRVWATRSSRGRTKNSPPNNNLEYYLTCRQKQLYWRPSFCAGAPADGLSVQALTRSCENKAAAKAKQMTNAPAQRRSIESHLSNLGAPSLHWAKKVMVAPFASEFQCQVKGHSKKIGAFGLNYPPLLWRYYVWAQIN